MCVHPESVIVWKASPSPVLRAGLTFPHVCYMSRSTSAHCLHAIHAHCTSQTLLMVWPLLVTHVLCLHVPQYSTTASQKQLVRAIFMTGLISAQPESTVQQLVAGALHRGSLKRLGMESIALGQLHWSTAKYAPLQERALWDGLAALYQEVGALPPLLNPLKRCLHSPAGPGCVRPNTLPAAMVSSMSCADGHLLRCRLLAGMGSQHPRSSCLAAASSNGGSCGTLYLQLPWRRCPRSSTCCSDALAISFPTV